MQPLSLGQKKFGAYRLYSVWGQPSESDREDVTQFWIDNGAFESISANSERAKQLVVVARDLTGAVAGVSTAVPRMVDQLGFRCFYYRTFVGTGHRNMAVLSKEILLYSYEILAHCFQRGEDADVLGLFLEIENADIMRHLNYAVWELDGMNVVYIGKSRRGFHCRVWYFGGARVP